MPRKFRYILFAVLLVLLVALTALLLTNIAGTDAPRYVTVTNNPPTSGTVFFNYGSDETFFGGKMWFWTRLSGTNYHEYCYDLEKSEITGELLNSVPVFFNADATKLLCEGPPSVWDRAYRSMAAGLKTFSHGRINLPATYETESFWMLNVKDGSARRLGRLRQFIGTGSTWKPAPGMRFAFNTPTDLDYRNAFAIVDFKNDTMKKILGKAKAWLDSTHLLFVDDSTNYLTYDATTGTTKPYLSVNEIAEQFKMLGITNAPDKLEAMAIWSGTNYEIFFADDRNNFKWWTEGTFRLKPVPGTNRLELVNRNFKLRWSGEFNEDRNLYVYPGEKSSPGSGGDGSLYLRNLRDGTTNMIVPPDGSGQYSLPKFYKDEVIYWHNRQIFRVDSTGSNNVRLFPPPVK